VSGLLLFTIEEGFYETRNVFRAERPHGNGEVKGIIELCSRAVRGRSPVLDQPRTRCP
jgi:hypothetical protein